MQVFIVDNAETMKNYWDQATYLLETLVMTLRELDDGLSLRFTSGPVQLSNRSRLSDFKSVMRSKDAMPSPGVHTDMTVVLADNLDRHLVELKRLNRRGQPLRQLTLIVLTDGLWEGTLNENAIEKTIFEFTNQQGKLVGPLRKRVVTIQFIQFGHDPQATRRLQHLDDELIYSGIP
jgi:hypothetical protein